ncbi:MAG TPA: hypothetical protein VMF89_15645, partial [Polyangiales bacterium]|nr:hypothetical protein [Polyangiales bacterium]
CVYFVVTRRSWLPSLLLLAAIAASALGRAHPGGDDNVRLPAYALSALVAALGFCDLMANRPRLRWPLTAALALQLAMLFQPPALYWPTQQTGEQFARLKTELTRCAGSSDFAAMDHADLGAHAFVHTLALSDLRMNRDELADQATQAVLTALSATPDPGSLAHAAESESAASSEAGATATADSPAPAGASTGWGADPLARAGARALGGSLARAGAGESDVRVRAPRALAISSSFPGLMRTLAEHYELCARTPALSLPTGFELSETFIYRHKSE